MKIKYLKDTHDSVSGDVKDVPDMAANVLIKIGIAEEFKEPVKRATTKAKSKTEEQE